MLATFALLALILSAVGIYLLAYSVGQRRHEIVVRMALGAIGREVRRMVLGERIKMTTIGAATGLFAALPWPQGFEGMLDGLRTADPQTYHHHARRSSCWRCSQLTFPAPGFHD
ncbi:MAG TPA: FtsX-like permease family protein [Terriglobales bacterium]|jgi:putative ABC transport system permease protein